MAVKATPSQVNAMMITERVTSILSLVGILFILSTFLLGRGFDKPINRLFFFASFSNLGMNIAALIAEDGVSAGQNSSLCQFQAFAIQWYVRWSRPPMLGQDLTSSAGFLEWILFGLYAWVLMFTSPCSGDGPQSACGDRNGNISLDATDAPSSQLWYTSS